MRSYNSKFIPQTTTASQQSNHRYFSKHTGSSNSTTSFQKNNFHAQHNVENNNDLSSFSKSYSNQKLNLPSENLSKNPKRSLVIDVDAEPQTYNLVSNNRIQPHTTTHHQQQQASLMSSKTFKPQGTINSNGSSKAMKLNEPCLTTQSSYSPKSNLIPSRSVVLPSGFPQSTTNSSSVAAAANRVTSISSSGSLDNFISQLSPKSLHLRSTSTKPSFFDSQKSPLQRSEQPQQNDISGTAQNARYENIELPNDEQKNMTVHHQTYNDDDEPNQRGETFKDYESGISYEYNREISNVLRGPAKKVLTPIPNHEPTKCSIKRNGIVKAYAANTNQGIVRNYNEDRVSIILNIMKPVSRMNEEWPKCSFFGVYDGHGGVSCADFLRDNLHQYVIKEPSFPWNPREAIQRGFEAAERDFLNYAESRPNGELDKSGSCAIVALIVGEMCYIANVGDSRAVMSGDGGTKVYHLSDDHKPSEASEQKRILDAGGKIYQTQAPAFRQVLEGQTIKNQMHYVLGPHRVFPGRLSVSRTFGDIEAKFPKYGGNPLAVIATPEIKSFKINETFDFIVLACDGIFDKLSSVDVVKSTWESTIDKASDIHQQCGLGVEFIMRESLYRRTLDNITVVMISLKNFKHKLFPRDKTKPTKKEVVGRMPDANASPNLIPNRSLMNGSILKQSTQALRDRLNDQGNEYSSFSGSGYGDDLYKRHLLRESSTNLTKGQAGKKMMEKESLPVMRDNYHNNGKRTTPKPGATGNAGNDENRFNSNPYLDYLQQSKILKVKSMDYKNGDFVKAMMKGAGK